MTGQVRAVADRVIASDDEAREAARELAGAIAPEASVRDRERRLPWAEVDDLRRSGLLGIQVPRSHGGADVSMRALGDVFRILSAADPSIGQLPQNHFVALEIVRLDGSDDQRRRFFAAALRGDLFGNATSERGTKTVIDMRTRLTRGADGGLRIDGRKYYSTGALFADWVPVFVKDEDDRFVVAIVPREAEGLTVVDDWSGMGQRTTASGTVELVAVPVDDGDVVPHWRSYQGPQILGAFGQIAHAAIDVGIAEGALRDGVTFLRERARPWFEAGVDRVVDEPGVISRVGELVVRLHAAQDVLNRAADVLDDARRRPLTRDSAGEASLAVAEARAVSTEIAIEVTNEIFALGGASSSDEELNLDRHWRNARTHTLHDPVRWKYHHVGVRALTGELPPYDNPWL